MLGVNLKAGGSGIQQCKRHFNIFNKTNTELMFGNCIWGEIIKCVGLFLVRVPQRTWKSKKIQTLALNESESF